MTFLVFPSVAFEGWLRNEEVWTGFDTEEDLFF